MTHYLSEQNLRTIKELIGKCNGDKGTNQAVKILDACVGKLFYEAKAGDIEAMKFLGKYWHEHTPTEEEKEYMQLEDYGWTWNGACFWYEKAAQAGDVGAMLTAGDMLFSENVTEGNNPRARGIKYLQKAADLGDFWALRFMAELYQDGVNEGSEILIEIDEKKALRYYFLAAELGDTDSMIILGQRYAAGKLVEKNFKKSLFWFQRAINEWDLRALAIVADMYYKGEDFEQNLSEALKWYQKGAEMNNCYCIGKLGIMYSKGEGVIQDEKKAEEFLLKALENPYVSHSSDFKEELAKIYLLKAQKLLPYHLENVEYNSCKADGTLVKKYFFTEKPISKPMLHIALAAFHFGDKSAIENLGRFGEVYYLHSDNETERNQGLEWLILAAENNLPQYLTSVFDRLKYPPYSAENFKNFIQKLEKKSAEIKKVELKKIFAELFEKAKATGFTMSD